MLVAKIAVWPTAIYIYNTAALLMICSVLARSGKHCIVHLRPLLLHFCKGPSPLPAQFTNSRFPLSRSIREQP